MKSFSADILRRFRDFAEKHNLLQKDQPVLLAVSGGVDSVVMCRLFASSCFSFGIAHCNFQLRGKESDEDQKFVEGIASTYKVPFFTNNFSTNQYADENGISVEMAARELRYEWFETIRKSNNYHAIATAHHRDDNIETVLLNLVRGTGISGLHGILPRRDKIIRPMLCLSKSEIIEFAKQEQLLFREDRTNSESIFQRNLLRNEVIPLLEKINPNFRDTFTGNIEKLREAESIFNKGLAHLRKKFIEKRGSDFYIPIKKLVQFESARSILFDLLKDFGFGEKQVMQIYDGLNEGSGKQYFSQSHRIIQNRNFLIVANKEHSSSDVILVEDINKHVKLREGELKFQLVNGAHFSKDASADTAFIDFNKLKFPLILRKWKKGDYFYPFGMKKKKKKLSDFFINNKISLLEKEKIWIIESEKKIVWVVGHRIDERFRITGNTKETLIVKKK